MTYWMAYCNEDVEITGIKRANKVDAVNDLKRGFETDCEEYSVNAAMCNDYYIEEYTETDTSIVIGHEEHYRMKMTKKHGATAVRSWER